MPDLYYIKWPLLGLLFVLPLFSSANTEEDAQEIISTMIDQASLPSELESARLALTHIEKGNPNHQYALQRKYDGLMIINPYASSGYELLKQAHRNDPQDSEIALSTIAAAIQQKQFLDAIDIARSSLVFNAGNSALWLALGRLYALIDDNEQATQVFLIAYHFSNDKARTLALYRQTLDDNLKVKMAMCLAVRQLQAVQ